ncbi:MAG: 23S rRNA (uracil(1939)-C(5))-methyltransferase RlmD [Thermodesulfobacteriota bacterium]
MAVKKGQLLDLKVSDLIFGGKGLAKIDGFAVFIDQAVPLDVATVRIVKKKKNYAEARIVNLLEPSPFRVTAPCGYSGYCGGCKWQFFSYEQQLLCKQQHVADALERIAKLEGVWVHPALASPQLFEYRNKMEFSCADRRWLLPDELGRPDIDFGFAIGLHVPGTFHKVIDTAACLLQPALGNRILNEVRNYIKASTAPVYGLRTHEGYWRFLMLRHSVSENQWMVNIITAVEDRGQVVPLAERLTALFPEIVSVVNNITARKAGTAVGEYEIQLAGAASIRDKIGSFEFEVSANSFFQTNTRGAERLYEIVKAYAGLGGHETVLDLYSGTGTIAIFLSGAAGEVIGLEIVESAVKDAVNNCRLNGVSNCRFIAGDIKESLGRISVRPDVMIVDPPRTGIHPDVVRQIIDMAPQRMVYVSCNPATLARDLALLKDFYVVREVQPVDMFPHTFHIEAVARLEKR